MSFKLKKRAVISFEDVDIININLEGENYVFETLWYYDGPKILLDYRNKAILYWNDMKNGFEEFVLFKVKDKNVLDKYLKGVGTYKEIKENSELSYLNWTFKNEFFEAEFEHYEPDEHITLGFDYFKRS